MNYHKTSTFNEPLIIKRICLLNYSHEIFTIDKIKNPALISKGRE